MSRSSSIGEPTPPIRYGWLSGLAFAVTIAVAGGSFGLGPVPGASAAESSSTPSSHAGEIDGMVLDQHGAAIVNDLVRTEIASGAP